LNKQANRNDAVTMLARIHHEGQNPNNKLYKGKFYHFCNFYLESAVHVKTVFADVNRHREKPNFVYDRVPERSSIRYSNT